MRVLRYQRQEHVSLTADEFEMVRCAPGHFAVYPEHVNGEFERVIESNARYTTVEKVAEAREVAEARVKSRPCGG